jgi:hypothetical protein
VAGHTQQRYKTSTALEAVTAMFDFIGSFRIDELAARYGGDQTVDRIWADFMRVEFRKAIVKAWDSREKVGKIVDRLDCYPNQALSEREDRISLHPNQCREPRCRVQKLLVAQMKELKAVYVALLRQPDKAENIKRHQVLRDIQKRPTETISNQQCRNIGDAYFVIACPVGAELVTTNVDDFAPLADVLGKQVRSP